MIRELQDECDQLKEKLNGYENSYKRNLSYEQIINKIRIYEDLANKIRAIMLGEEKKRGKINCSFFSQ